MSLSSVDSVIDAYVASLGLAAEAEQDIENARSDLYHGPLYFDADGDECSCFDEGATQFDFRAACQRIAEALSDIEAIYVDTDADDWSTSEPEGWTDEETGEYYEPDTSFIYYCDRHDIMRRILGRELSVCIS